jgi:iron transport multicopper oxidase
VAYLVRHVASGLIATMIEAPLSLQKQLNVKDLPASHLAACKDTQTPISGNAAGNTNDLLDVKGENTSPKELPGGFEARGIVALVFSCVAAAVGCAVIVWYGLAPITA